MTGLGGSTPLSFRVSVPTFKRAKIRSGGLKAIYRARIINGNEIALFGQERFKT
jgi:hypothetical protein